jgi:pseudaminic acid cytidylyltransferase
MSALAVIPARGGSKRVPGKNIRLLAGRPAIAYTIEAALESRVFEAVVVSTDSPEIAEVAKQCGAEVPFLRSAQLADDHTPVSVVTADTVRRLRERGMGPHHVAQLMPNCPMRDARDICLSYDSFVASGADAQISVASYAWQNPFWAMSLDEAGKIRPVFEDHLKARSQDLEQVYCPTGAVWWAVADALVSTDNFYGPSTTAWVINWFHSLDVDTPEDWEIAQQWMVEQSLSNPHP